MNTSSMPSPLQIIQGLEFIAMKYRWLAIVQHLVILVIAFCYWAYRERMAWVLSLYFFLTCVLVGTLALVEANNLITCAVFGILAVMFLTELVSPEMDYSTKRLKWYNLSVALIAGCYALWYPFSGDYIDSVISSPYGILPTPTLLIIQAFFLAAFDGTNKKLHGFLTVCSFYYGIMGVVRFKVYWDIPLLVVAIYSLVMLNLSRDRTSR
jgi:hypothetical protein